MFVISTINQLFFLNTKKHIHHNLCKLLIWEPVPHSWLVGRFNVMATQVPKPFGAKYFFCQSIPIVNQWTRAYFNQRRSWILRKQYDQWEYPWIPCVAYAKSSKTPTFIAHCREIINGCAYTISDCCVSRQENLCEVECRETTVQAKSLVGNQIKTESIINGSFIDT